MLPLHPFALLSLAIAFLGPVAAGAATAEPASASEASPDVQLATAFRTVFGRAERAVVEHEGRVYDVEPGGLERIGPRLVLITLATMRDAYHPDEGAIGLYYMEPAAGGFRVAGRWPFRIGGSQFGTPTLGWTIRRDLGRHPLLVSRGAWTGQGYRCEWARLDELTPAGPVSRGTISYFGYSDEGAVEDPAKRTSVTGKIVAWRGDRGFDVRYSGTHRFVERYRRRGAVYEPAGKSFFDGKC